MLSILAKIRLVMTRGVLYPLLYLFGIVIKVDPKLILFTAFNGSAYSDNPRYIFEYMLEDEQYRDYQFIWAFKDKQLIEGSKTVKFNSIKYYYYLSKAKYWVFNAKMAPYYYKKSSQVYLQTWHGTPLKRLGHDIVDNGTTYYRSKQSYQQMVKSYDNDSRHWDYLIASSPFSCQVFSTAFVFSKEKMLKIGYPRVDYLLTVTNENILELKQRYHLPLDKKIILYAPTWRDQSFGNNGYTFELSVDFYKWQEVLGDEYVILFKPHYLISNSYQCPEELRDFVYLMAANEDINDAYLISDILITDYSSVFFDYAVLNRPIYFYMYDFAYYEQELRGFYLDVPDELPNDIVKTEASLLQQLQADKFDFKRLARFNQKFNPWYDGLGLEKLIKEVFDEI